MSEHVHEVGSHGRPEHGRHEHGTHEHPDRDRRSEEEHRTEHAGGEHGAGGVHHEGPQPEGSVEHGREPEGTVAHEHAPPPRIDPRTDGAADAGASQGDGTPAVATADPVADATRDLDQLGSSRVGHLKPVLKGGAKTVREVCEARLRQTSPEKAWRETKQRVLTEMRKRDPSLVAEVRRVTDADLAGALSEWSKLVKADKLKGDRILAADHKLAGILGDYDRELAFIEANAHADVMSHGELSLLRELLRAIATKVSSDTKWLADAGAFK